jgi:hypothetical protein
LACPPHHVGLLADYSFVYASRGLITGATLCWLLLGYINQVTTSLLNQLGGYPKEAASKVLYTRQSKVDFYSRILKSAPRGNLKSTLVASSPTSVAYYVCKLRWNIAVSGPHVLATMVPSRSGGNSTLGLKSMAQVLKPTPVAEVDANSRTQAHSCCTS